MAHTPPNCEIEYRKESDGGVGTYCLTHGGVRICNVCKNNKEAHYVGPKLSHTPEEYKESESEIEKILGKGK